MSSLRSPVRFLALGGLFVTIACARFEAVDGPDAALSDAAPPIDASADSSVVDGSAPRDGGPCNGAAACERFVFVTAGAWDGTLGGPTAADALCKQEADLAPEVAGRSWQAWLSNNATSPAARFAKATARYKRVDGKTVAANFVELATGRLQNPILLTAGAAVLSPPPRVWTATLPTGLPMVAANRCSEWSTADPSYFGGVGNQTKVDKAWTDDGETDCSDKMHLYCFEY